LSDSGVAASGYVALDLLRVQRAAFGQDQFLLFSKKGPLVSDLPGIEFGDRCTFQVLRDYLLSKLAGYPFVYDVLFSLELNCHQRAAAARAKTAGTDRFNLGLKPLGLHGFLQGVLNCQRSGRNTGSTGTDEQPAAELLLAVQFILGHFQEFHSVHNAVCSLSSERFTALSFKDERNSDCDQFCND